MKAIRLALILTGGFAMGGICYLAVRHYDNTIAWRSYYFEVPDPCRPKWLAAITNSLPSDGTLQQKMAGTWWHCMYPHYLDDKLIWRLSRVTVASNGGYVCHLTFSDGVIHTNAIQGQWQVKHGLLYDTITNYSFRTTNEPVLHVFSNQLLRVTDRELVYRHCPDGDVVLFRRVKQLNR